MHHEQNVAPPKQQANHISQSKLLSEQTALMPCLEVSVHWLFVTLAQMNFCDQNSSKLY